MGIKYISQNQWTYINDTGNLLKSMNIHNNELKSNQIHLSISVQIVNMNQHQGKSPKLDDKLFKSITHTSDEPKSFWMYENKQNQWTLIKINQN